VHAGSVKAGQPHIAHDETSKVGKRLRGLDPKEIVPLSDGIEKIGLLDPITVREADNGEFVLVFGLHRLEAFKRLGRLKIPCRVVQIDARTSRLWELSENLHRVELTVLQRSEQTAEWIQLTADQLAEQPKSDVSAQIDPKPQGGRPEGGIRAAARELGVDRNKARRAMKLLEKIPQRFAMKSGRCQRLKGSISTHSPTLRRSGKQQLWTRSNLVRRKTSGRLWRD
jgi:uncharacterized ParB-like nuclease family protein